MEKYKNILRAVREAFPESQDVRLIVFTTNGERAFFEANIDKILDLEDVSINEFSKNREGATLGFNGKIFVTNDKR